MTDLMDAEFRTTKYEPPYIFKLTNLASSVSLSSIETSNFYKTSFRLSNSISYEFGKSLTMEECFDSIEKTINFIDSIIGKKLKGVVCIPKKGTIKFFMGP